MQAAPCQTILDYPRSDDNIRAYAEKALNYNTRAQHTIRLFHYLSAGETTEEKPVATVFSPNDILLDLLDTYHNIADSRGIRFTVDIPSRLIWVSSPQVLAAVTDMLLTDSFFHTESGQGVSLKLSTKEENLILTISMSGSWPDPKITDILFNRTAIMDYLEQSGRSGYALQDEMRLAVCRSMVTSVEGQITHQLENGQSVFTVNFPRMQSTDEAPPERNTRYRSDAAALLEPADNFKSMLVLSQDLEILQTISSLFKSEFRIRSLGNAQAMLDALKDTHPDVIIVEMLNESQETEAVVRAVKEDKTTVKIPVILIVPTTKDDLPADACITLPLDVKELKNTVGQNIRRMESLADYFSSAVSIYELSDGKRLHRDDKEFLEKLYRIIRNNMHKSELSTGMIAAEMNMSIRNLYSRLQQLVSITPNNIVREYRLAYAAQLLSKTRFTVDEIIYRSGFSNRGTFFKNFSKRYGCTPKVWRKEHQ